MGHETEALAQEIAFVIRRPMTAHLLWHLEGSLV